MTVKRWTHEDEDFIIQNYSKLTNRELSDRFGVSTIAIQRKLARLKLMRQFQKKWTAEEESYLRDNYSSMSDKALAKVFNVTEVSIKRKLARLGYKRNIRSKPARAASAAPLFIQKHQSRKAVSKSRSSAKPSAPAAPAPPRASAPPRPAVAVRREKVVEPALGRVEEKTSAPPLQMVNAREAASTARNGREASGHRNGSREERVYEATGVYEVGEMIFHKAWSDRGRVVKVLETSGGNTAIIVDFARHGKRTLISGLDERHTKSY